MRGSRTLSTQSIDQNEDGTPMNEEELKVKRKYIDFAKITFPEVNPIDFTVPAIKGNGQVRLQNYRYPCAPGVERKGIVQYIHGNSDYGGRYAFMAKTLAENGYEVFALDRRGFGFSEGQRGYLHSIECIKDDVLTYSQKVKDVYGGEGVPYFTIGHSLGSSL